MAQHYYINPEAAGGFGDRTIIDRSSGKMVVQKLHYHVEGWLGDELLETAPCFIASERVAFAVEQLGLSGTRIDDVEITTSDEFKALYPDRQLPKFVWLKVDGRAGQDDFGMAPGLRLVVSDRALDLLKRFGLSNASVAPFTS